MHEPHLQKNFTQETNTHTRYTHIHTHTHTHTYTHTRDAMTRRNIFLFCLPLFFITIIFFLWFTPSGQCRGMPVTKRSCYFIHFYLFIFIYNFWHLETKRSFFLFIFITFHTLRVVSRDAVTKRNGGSWVRKEIVTAWLCACLMTISLSPVAGEEEDLFISNDTIEWHCLPAKSKLSK